MFMFFGNYSKRYIWSAHFNNYIEERTQKQSRFFDVSAYFVTKTAYLIRCTFGSLKSNGDKS